ncbi:MAG: hypothetical protein R3200_12315 [Xanthomonadales bacterium]|nr:hypothetical protein [Xanthomonadales bacterium]
MQRMTAIFGTALLMLSIGACTPVPLNTTAHNYKDEDRSQDLVCTREKPIGSNRVEKVCRTRAQIAAEERATQDELRRQQSTTSRIRAENGGG